MGHTVSRHKMYMVSRSDKFPDPSTARRQQDIIAMTSKSSKQNGNILNGDVRGQTQLKSKQADRNGNMIVHGKVNENGKSKKTKITQEKQNGHVVSLDKVKRDTKTNNKGLQEQQPKPRVQLTQPKLLHTPSTTPNGMLKMDIHTPVKTTKTPFVMTSSPQVDSSPRDRIPTSTIEYQIQSESISPNTEAVSFGQDPSQTQLTVNVRTDPVPETSRQDNDVLPLNHVADSPSNDENGNTVESR